jgi:hypothetical protein
VAAAPSASPRAEWVPRTTLASPRATSISVRLSLKAAKWHVENLYFWAAELVDAGRVGAGA